MTNKFIIIGPQGSGKGTQAKILSEKLNIPNISIGDLLRNAKGELKQEINKYIDKGLLAPIKIIIKLLKQRIQQPDCKNGFILDGYPRNSEQAKLLDQIASIDKVIEITLSDQEAIKRLSSRLSCKNCNSVYNTITNPPKKPNICDNCESELFQRPDDKPEAIKKRLAIYHQETKPLIETYKNKLITINGEQPIDDIAKEIEGKLEN